MIGSKSQKSLVAVARIVRELAESNALESGQRDELLRGLARLTHGMRVNNLEEVDAAVGDIARAVLKVSR
jgi:hypothetical protein